MSTRSLVIELPADHSADTPIVVLPQGAHHPLEGGAAVVIEAGRAGFVLRAPALHSHVTPIEDQTLSQGGWRLRREGRRVGENTLAEGTRWGQPELRIFPRVGGAPQAVKLPLDEGASLIVGRSGKQAEVVVDDDYVSRRHARFVVRGGSIFVEDLGSQWGVFVDDQRISAPTQLRDGAKLLIGKTRIQFLHLLAAFERLPAPESAAAAPCVAPRAPAEQPAADPSQAASRASAPLHRTLAPLAVVALSLSALAYYLATWLRATA